MFGRRIDRAFEASRERHEEFMRELESDRRRFEREMEQRYREEVQATREFMRRNELVTLQSLETLREMREDIKAHTKAIFQVLDRFEDGGGEAAAS